MVAGNDQINGFDVDTEQRDILKLSHGTAIVLLFSEFHSFPFLTTLALERSIDVFPFQVYASYLVFQLFSHKSLYDDKNDQTAKSIKYTGPSAKERIFGRKEATEGGTSKEPANHHPDDDLGQGTDVEQQGITVTDEDDEEKEETPELSVPVTIILLVVVTALVAVTAEWLVDSIDGLASGHGISKEFIGLILLPIVGNAAEHATAVTVSVKDKLTLSLGVAVGSSIVGSPLPPSFNILNLILSP